MIGGQEASSAVRNKENGVVNRVKSIVDFAIIIVAYDSSDDLRELLNSVAESASPFTWHVTIVNNAPTVPLDAFAQVHANVDVIEAGENLGYSGGINLGARSAPTARWIAVLNPDLTLAPGALAALGRSLAGGAAASVPILLDFQGRRQNSLRREPSLFSALGDALLGDAFEGRPHALSETVRDPSEYVHGHDIDWATGAALAIRSDVADEIGDWDSHRFFMYSEEADVCRRIREAGGVIRFVPEAVAKHRGGGSGSSPQLDALREVNKLRYFSKWHGATASAVFGVILFLRNAVRPHRAGCRTAVRALLSSRARARLPGGPR